MEPLVDLVCFQRLGVRDVVDIVLPIGAGHRIVALEENTKSLSHKKIALLYEKEVDQVVACNVLVSVSDDPDIDRIQPLIDS